MLQQKIGAVEPRSLGIEIVVVNAPMVNAFALPGGKVVLTSGILDFMEDGDELAGVLAHEIGHVALGHPMEGLLSQVGLQLLLNLVSGGGSGDVVGIGVMMASTSYSREYEREADRLALKILTDARIEPRAYGDLFARFAAKDGEQSGAGTVGLGNLLRTHPYSDERADQARGVQVPDPQPALTDEAWMAIKSLCGTEDRNR